MTVESTRARGAYVVEPVTLNGYTKDRARVKGRAMYKPLSPREKQILTLLAEGRSRIEIGQYLGISENTVGSFIARARAKLGTDSTISLVARSQAMGLISPTFGKMSARDAARRGLTRSRS